MDRVAIDLGGINSQVCVRSGDGKVKLERKIATRRLRDFFATIEPSVVILETCAEAMAVAGQAKAYGHDVRIVPATLVRSLGVGARGVKTDERDAQALSAASCRVELQSVHIPSSRAWELKQLMGAREALVHSRTLLCNHVKGQLRSQLLRVRAIPQRLPQAVRRLLLEKRQGMPLHLERVLKSLEVLTEQILEANKEIARIAKSDPVCRRMMTVPGVGPITSLRFLSTVDDPTRFKKAHQLESYLGLTPGEDSSSSRQRRTGITKAGSSAVRWTLVEAAWSFCRSRPEDPAAIWCKDMAKRRGKKIAVVALARKLAGILFAIWRDGTNYEPSRTARAATISGGDQLAA
jgi:transposase